MKGQTIAVTGAAGRLGRELVAELVRREANVAAIVMNDAEARLVPSGRSSRVESFIMNVTESRSVCDGFERIASRFSGLDGLVHTVGGWAMTPLLETGRQRWDDMMALNLTSAFLCFREASRVMVTGDGGWLVGISSGQGAERGAGGQSAYSAGKAGVLRLVEAVGEELADRGVSTLAVAPSMILFDDDSDWDGVPVGDVVAACLSPWSDDPPESGGLRRAYGTLEPG
ncbi:MAG: SDR family NAD(P)-dependent oxidoreductase [Rhodothermales bacterium]|nr:SDR family NAD(P)-dependent oxidoreductase [Rhodothermales bacterium]MBO6779183.1 SDR family NAD(P)-dependent oxidoreductase [Rhodothermales bacterium]